MQFSVLSSGSKANCTVIKNKNNIFLIDCGLSARETCKRLNSLSISPEQISGVILTHEHRDHIAGLKVLCKKYSVPVYTNAETATVLESFGILDNIETNIFKTGHLFSIGDFQIRSFPIPHDAVAPVGYEVFFSNQKLTYATDFGKVTPLIQEACQNCDALILEFNHDEQLLWLCDYHWQLKQRIASNKGHLENKVAAKLVAEVNHKGLKHLVLAHISENSNTWATAINALEKFVNTTSLTTCCYATPYSALELVSIGETASYKEQRNFLSINS